MIHTGPPLAHLRQHPEVISTWIPYNGMILAVLCVLAFLLRYYLIEPLARRIYGERFTTLGPRHKRGVVNHMVAGSIKIMLVAIAAYPVFAVLIKRDLHYPYAPGSPVRLGDMCLVITNMVTAMYIFELFHRETVSPIGVFHHVGAIIIAQTGLVLGLDPRHRADASIEFVLILVWGIFDVVAEFWPHLAMLIYRYRPNAHRKNAKIFLMTVFSELTGTFIETVTVMILFGSFWNTWTLTFKITTPVLHLLFTLAQLWNARVFWGLYREKKRLAALEEGEGGEGQGEGEMGEEGKQGEEGLLGVVSVRSKGSEEAIARSGSVSVDGEGKKE
ncbi:Hypothetical protein D9617_26g079090 [Elsinoe fawcettii]|nr:Hypothetical protein D9617_26g079090 [Elsinoe fawcettii]